MRDPRCAELAPSLVKCGPATDDDRFLPELEAAPGSVRADSGGDPPFRTSGRVRRWDELVPRSMQGAATSHRVRPSAFSSGRGSDTTPASSAVLAAVPAPADRTRDRMSVLPIPGKQQRRRSDRGHSWAALPRQHSRLAPLFALNLCPARPTHTQGLERPLAAQRSHMDYSTTIGRQLPCLAIRGALRSAPRQVCVTTMSQCTSLCPPSWTVSSSSERTPSTPTKYITLRDGESTEQTAHNPH